MNIDKRALKGVVDEIEASRARQKGETEFQREALKRAVKNYQLDAKAIRIVLQRRAMGQTKRDEQDYYVHAYELALGGKKDALEALEHGASIREAARAGGISTGAAAALAKGVQESSFVNTDRETAAVKQPGGDSRHDRRPDGPGSVAANPIEDATGRLPGDATVSPLGSTADRNEGGDHVAHEPDGQAIRPIDDDESLAAGVAAHMAGDRHDAGHLIAGPEVARAAPPAPPHNPDWIESPPAFLDRRQRVA